MLKILPVIGTVLVVFKVSAPVFRTTLAKSTEVIPDPERTNEGVADDVIEFDRLKLPTIVTTTAVLFQLTLDVGSKVSDPIVPNVDILNVAPPVLVT